MPRYIITRHASDPPRLMEVTGSAAAAARARGAKHGCVHARCVMTGKRQFVREADILGGDDDLDTAFARFEAVKSAARALDAEIAAARRAYDRAHRRREAELRRLAEGPAPARAEPGLAA
ncbi:hypothetical protein [Hyphomonas sp.]|uniref:hypothetical protein n=1 Tax=Hyphomonas sp. TaxID=87 RepID=UPI00391BD16D